MNSVLNMVNYYKTYDNVDNVIVDYLYSIIDKMSLFELIILEIELLYIESNNTLINILIDHINTNINVEYKSVKLSDLVILIDNLKNKRNEMYLKNNDSIVKSINIWINNIDNNIVKMLNGNLDDLIISYIKMLEYINNSDYINEYINLCSNKIDNILLKSNILNTITDVIPVLHKIYDENYLKDKKLSKLLDYYIDLVDSNIKRRLSKLDYIEKLVLKDKINAISYGILHNNTKSDDFKVMIINNYLKYI